MVELGCRASAVMPRQGKLGHFIFFFNYLISIRRTFFHCDTRSRAEFFFFFGRSQPMLSLISIISGLVFFEIVV